MKTIHYPKRRLLIKQLGLGVVASAVTPVTIAANDVRNSNERKKVLRIANITDVHIRPELNAPNRFKKCLEDIKKHEIDFFLNGGDTILAADYNDIKRNRVTDQWAIWQELRNGFSEYKMYSCLGNHDMWWAAPSKNDSMYGKDYVVKQLGIPKRYYSFDKVGWHFIVLDSNNENAGSLDYEQRIWLENDLDKLPAGTPILIMSHYPILGVSTIPYGGNHTDSKYITKIFYKHPDKKINCISGHMHLLDNAVYNNVNYFCNGSLSGFWWGEGDKESAGKGWYQETPPGYAIMDLFEDGTLQNNYYPHSY
ncbi:metallophosphoesterase [Flavobacteriaceae bacterium F89]|uniref:Metallophosphoesterase n=1 Tax=Cerina litoralis TaxID=2874477 RepID=A0AAE3EXD0_9FLAO|nr:metallophosphoesterase [Cerina litoralis]MCG2461486.1 metallophosphoesterase [Cerina litoralis]